MGTALHCAVYYNQLAIAKLLLDNGAGICIYLCNLVIGIIPVCYNNIVDPDKKDSKSRSSLHIACCNPSNGDIAEMLTVLIERYMTLYISMCN